MENKTEYIGLFIFSIAILGNIIFSLSKTSLSQLRYNRLWPFLFGILYGAFAYSCYLDSKRSVFVFALILGVAGIWRILKPIEPTDDQLSDPKNYKGGFFYYNKQDKRIFQGGPPNFANPVEMGILILVFVAFACLALIKR